MFLPVLHPEASLRPYLPDGRMDIKIAALADAANVSQEGKLNITGIFNQINAAKLPVTWPLMVMVLRVEAHSSEVGGHDILIRVADEDGREVAKITGDFEVGTAVDPGKPIIAQFIIPIAGARFEKHGTYSFDILIDGRYEGSTPLFVQPRG